MTPNELSNLLTNTNLRHKLKFATEEDTETNLIKGNLDFSQSPSGIALHRSRCKEHRNFTSTAQIPACISINFLFSGDIAFSLGSQHYKFSAQHNQCRVIVNLLPQSEVFSRFGHQGNHVTKLNIMVEKDWLVNRQLSKEDQVHLGTLFTNEACVFSWEASNRLKHNAQALFEMTPATGIFDQLQQEQQAFSLLAEVLFAIRSRHAVSPMDKPQTPALGTTLRTQIEPLVKSQLSLDQIAKQLGMSVSTMQRKFKKEVGLTVVEYLRQQRLAIAKTALVLDNKTIGEAAYLAGYHHTSNFIAAFKKQYKVTPNDFLKQHV